jgi:hypothetical protein
VWRLDHQGETLVVVFEGYLSADEGRTSARAVARAVADAPAPVELLLDVAAMAGYATEARRAWQTALSPHRDKLRGIRTRGASTIIRMGATVLGLFLGFNVHHEAAPTEARWG